MHRVIGLVALLMVLCLAACGPFAPAAATPEMSENRFGPWQVIAVARPDAPTLLSAEADGFRLDPAWQIASITSVDKWWGLAEPSFEVQRIERQGDGFVSDGVAVPADRVQAVLDAMGGFYSTQFNLVGQQHTDDYPSRLFELVGTDGARFILTSESTDNPGAGPWNLSYNGQQWAQFDGSVGMALLKLFNPDANLDYLTTGWEGQPWTQVAFSTTGQARQDIEGLLELRDSLYYHASDDKQAIEGYIEGSNSIAKLGNMVIGTFDKLVEVALTLPDGNEIQCATTTVPTDDPAGHAWEFTCPLGVVAAAQGFYHLPIRVTLGTKDNQVVTSEGALVGSWDEFRLDEDSSSLTTTTLPVWLSDAIAADARASTMLAAHRHLLALYEGTIPVGEGPTAGTYSGQVVWAGWREHEGRQLPYTISSAFAYEGGKLSIWSLTAKLTAALADETLAQLITQRLLTELPALKLNLFYDDVLNTDFPEGNGLMNGGSFGLIGTEIGACAGLPGPAMLGDSAKPLRAFGFNGDGTSGYWNDALFVLLDGKMVVAAYDAWAKEYRTPLDDALLPALFRDGPDFERIRMESSDYFSSGPMLTLSVADDFPTAQLDTFNDFIKQLPGKVDNEWVTIWDVSGVTFAADDQGYLVVHDCDPDD